MPENWKVVAVDNFNRETVADCLISDGHTEEEARRIADEMNEGVTDLSPCWHQAKPASYKLWRGMEELV